jgi:tetratricopeptide (TPR) repeat protein
MAARPDLIEEAEPTVIIDGAEHWVEEAVERAFEDAFDDSFADYDLPYEPPSYEPRESEVELEREQDEDDFGETVEAETIDPRDMDVELVAEEPVKPRRISETRARALVPDKRPTPQRVTEEPVTAPIARPVLVERAPEPPVPSSRRGADGAPQRTTKRPSPYASDRPPVVRADRPMPRTKRPPAVLDAVETRLRDAGQWTELVELYLQRIEGTRAPGEKAELLRRIGGAMRDGLKDAPQALDAFVEALLLEPRDEDTGLAVEELARAQKGWRQLVESVASQLDGIGKEEGGKERQIALCEHLVRWTRRELGRRDAAQQFIDRIHAIDPSHPAIHRQLASVYREHGQWDSQRDALTRALLASRGDEERKLLHVTLGELHEHRFQDLVAAATQYQEALKIDPKAVDALLGLERIYRTQERFHDLAQVLEQQVEASLTDDAKANALLRVAELHELHFVKPSQAAPKLEEALAIEPSNVTALLALERCYHAMRAWTELVKTLERRVTVERKAGDKIALLFQAAEILESKVNDPEAAARTYRRVFELDDRSAPALTELSRLAERAQDWTTAAAYRARLADLQPTKELQARMHVAIGEMLAPEGRDRARARKHFEKAAEIHPGNTAAWEALERDAREDGDIDRATVYLEKRIAHTESPRVKAQLLVELARIHAGLGEVSSAALAYERAIQADPVNEAAADAMLVRYTKAERWAEAQPLCDLLVNCATRDGDVGRTFDLLRTATRIAIELGNHERAVMAALAAHRAQPDATAVSDLVDVCHRVRTDAVLLVRAHETIDAITMAAKGLAPDTLAKLAEVHGAMGDEPRAIELLTRALAADAEHRGALGAMADLYLARGDWERGCVYKRKLAHAASDPDEQFTLLVDAGELLAHRAQNLPVAALAYEEALALRPRDHWLLHTLMWLYGELECWEKLVEILRGVADLESEGSRKAKSIYAIAQVMRDKLNDLPRAAAEFEAVLDLDPKRLDAFERIVRIHTELRDWTELKSAYGRMLRRLRTDADVELRYALFFQLGLIFRDRMGDAARALDAFRAAARLKPEGDEVRRVVCELLVVTDKVAEAIAMVRAAIKKQPQQADLYAELYELFCRQRAFDKAWCALDAFGAVGGAMNTEQARFYADFPPTLLSSIPGTLTGVAWRSHVLHGDLDPALTAIFAVVTPAVLRARLAVVQKDWLAKSLGEPLAPEGATATSVLKAVRNGAEVLGLEKPTLHARKGPPIPLDVTMVKSAMFVSLDTCAALTPEALSFVVGKHLAAAARPEIAARAAFQSLTELKALVHTAISLARGEAVTKAPSGAAGAFHKALTSSLTPEERQMLRNAVSAARAEGTTLDVARWSQLAEVSASRAGLLLGGRIEAARRAMAHEAQAPGDLSSKEMMNELLVFSVSDEYSDLRQAIGVGVRLGT